MILPLNTDLADLGALGGKGLNLAKLVRAGIPVPRGFLLASQAYQDYVESNRLRASIARQIELLQTDDVAALEEASVSIRAMFSSGRIPDKLEDSLRQAYRSLGEPPVAVRSSATAEDLPDLSFAGLQDTYLNVQGLSDLLKAVVNCWSSLWTARAIGYRTRNEVSHDDVALAVVIQEMVQAEASGVLFTSNPLTGLRSETVIDATLGLGEALVAGLVEPDHYVVDHHHGVVREKILGAKTVAIHGKEGGGVATHRLKPAGRQALPDDQILELSVLGQRIAALYGFPQDIEWAMAGDRIYILQSRPITSLFPIPEGTASEPLQVFFSFGSAQGLLDPITPLGRDAIRLLFAGAAGLFGYAETHETQGVIKMAGERLWANFTPLVRTKIGSRIFARIAFLVDPGIVPAAQALRDSPPWPGGLRRVRLATIRRIFKFIAPYLRQFATAARHPEGRAEKVEREAEKTLVRIQSRYISANERGNSLADRVAFFRSLTEGFPNAIPIMANAMGGMLPLMLLISFSRRQTGSDALALAVTRGLPHNVTTEMDLALWEAARTIRDHPGELTYFRDTEANRLAAEFLAGRLPPAAQKAIGKFLKQYGMRGLGEIDIGRPRWREDPTHIMQVIKGYLMITDRGGAPDEVFRRGAESANLAVEELAAVAQATIGGAVKARLVRSASKRVRELAGLRESPKYFLVRMMGTMRSELLESAQDLAARGILGRPEDLFYLYLNELEALAAGRERDWQSLVDGRRADIARESRRRQIPRLLFSDGRAVYEGLTAPEGESGVLIGSPVSPGLASGSVRVVLDPAGAV
ncbi:MAG: PEP/pyruvate-binding domain-containing protein, partial [Anaerolineales bacterium]|nr:PEP/pyruvate-binding domain-containing protein [Anaerolineales bacterium]